MFSGCNNITIAPELPAEILTSYCYRNMFFSCYKLQYIKMLATDITANGCLIKWVYGVGNTGTRIFVKNALMTTLTIDSENGIPTGWTVQDA